MMESEARRRKKEEEELEKKRVYERYLAAQKAREEKHKIKSNLTLEEAKKLQEAKLQQEALEREPIAAQEAARLAAQG